MTTEAVKPDKVYPGPLFTVSLEGERLRKLMRATAPGELLTYARIREEVGADIREHRGLWASAADHLLDHDRIVFVAVAGEGYRRCTDEDIAGKTHEQIVRIHRQAVRALKYSAAANREALAPETRQALDANTAIAGAILIDTAPAALKDRAVNDRPIELTGDRVRAIAAGLATPTRRR